MEKTIHRFNKEFIKNYDESSDKRYILEVDVEYPKNLYNLHSELPFLPERMKTKLNGPEKLLCNIHNKKNYVVHIRQTLNPALNQALKQALNHGLILKKVHRVTQFNQEAWLQSPFRNKTDVLWEFLKYEIRKFPIDFSKNKVKLRREKLSRLEVKLKELEQNLGNDEAKEQYNAYRGEINEIYDEISNRIKIKSKCD